MKWIPSRRSRPWQNRRGTLQVDVAPVEEKQSARFPRFLNWLRSIFRVEDGEAATEEVRQYVDDAKEAARATMHAPGIKNAHFEAQLSQELAKAEHLRVVAESEERLFDEKQAFHRAQTAKVQAETEAIEVETKLRVLKDLHRLGFEVIPILRNGKLEGLYVTKALAQRYERGAQKRSAKSHKPTRRREG